jgi:hypothetical protein
MAEGFDTAPYFGEEVQTMARRQFGVSIVVGIALVVAATLIGSRPTPPLAAATAGHRLVVQPEAPVFDIGRAGGSQTRG